MKQARLAVRSTSAFKRDYKLMMRRGRKIELLDNVIKDLATCSVLAAALKDHELGGKWSRYRECHIQPDWLLIYQIDLNVPVLILVRTGTHSDLFG